VRLKQGDWATTVDGQERAENLYQGGGEGKKPRERDLRHIMFEVWKVG
jgi:hypothetical protein